MISLIPTDHEDTYSLGLLVEDGLGLTSVTALLSCTVSTDPLGMIYSSSPILALKLFLPIEIHFQVHLFPLVPTIQ
jgi:hypothetical protein